VEDGVATVVIGRELPHGGVGWLIQKNSKEDFEEDPDEDMWDASSRESCC